MKYIRGVNLPQLPNEVVKNARKTRLDAFAVALEGWRRGLKLVWYTRDSKHFDEMIIFGVNPPGRLFSLSSEEKTHYFFRTRGDKVTSEAVELAADKGITKEILRKNKVPVPHGKGFSEDTTDEEIIAFSKKIGYPLVFKPTDASLGNGVVTNINTEEEFEKALNYVRSELGYKEVVVEQHAYGKEYRVYVIEDQVIAAYNRIPANITGDGVHSIEQLIDLKNFDRRQNARLNSCLIHVDVEIIEFIEKKNYDLNSIPAKGEHILLREKTNVSSGGDPIDVTDVISEEIKEIAINSVKAIPGLYHAGVDIIVNDDTTSNRTPVVIEINATAQIGGILYPLRGKARNIPKAIIDYYFPETIGIDTSQSKIYFDMKTVLEPMENRVALEVEVAPAPMGRLYAKQYIVSGNVQSDSYHRWLRNNALDKGLNGYINEHAFDEIEVVIAGINHEEVKDFKNIIKKYHGGTKVKEIKGKEFNEPIPIGFDIIGKFDIGNLRSTQSTMRLAEKELIRITRRKERVEKDINHILTSNSWKITEFLRRDKGK